MDLPQSSRVQHQGGNNLSLAHCAPFYNKINCPSILGYDNEEEVRPLCLLTLFANKNNIATVEQVDNNNVRTLFRCPRIGYFLHSGSPEQW